MKDVVVFERITLECGGSTPLLNSVRQLLKRCRVSALQSGFAACFIALSAVAENPNILLIMIDDLNRQVGCFDGPAITPNIDQLAASGIKFNNAYSACPSCNPSRVSLMTGQRPEKTGVYSNVNHFRSTSPAKDLTTWPQLMKANGYNTIAAGKIFHGRVKKLNPKKSKQKDESDSISWTYQPIVDGGQFFGPNFDEQFHDKDGLPRWVYNTTGPEGVDPKDRKALKGTWVYGPIDVEPSNTLDFNTCEFGAAWLNQDQSDPQVKAAPSADEKPFLLACGVFRPHIPILAPQEFFDLYTTEENKHRLELPYLPADDCDDLPSGAGKNNHWYNRYLKPFPKEQVNLRHAYLAATSYADAAVGILLEGLAKSKYADNTIVILMGDHGYDLGEKDHLGKSVVWKNASSMPMVIRMPKGASGTVAAAVSMIDIYPTLVELLDLNAPQPLDGTSLVPLLKDPGAKRDVPAVITNTGGNQIGVVLDQWHYISYNDGSEELYDHSVDPREITNLMYPANFSEKYLEVAKRLKKFIPENRK
ncbi:sulfatase [Pontiella sulfatireligans]|uniref:Choline-sulfatase n=1 Tax=Pontiella sulfatireligans TaxID=2750658 RepID=A0A6C2UHD7_9BACT|nr:sulfatase [Pontiella sulfatireligans]SPS74258.1 sulfatase S1_7 [Kiritimatiellales bacterium]VGO18917.1 Choline-sulfatase [Pontiella sulfatireligans]